MTQDIRTIRIATQGPAGPAGLYPHASWDGGQVPYAGSSVLAHNGGIWLALRDTSVEPAVDVPDDWASWLDVSGMISGFATLDDGGKIPASQLPAIAITDTYAVASQAAMLALTAETGDIAIRSDLSKSFVLAVEPAATLANWKELLTPTDAVQSVAGRTGAVTLSAGDISGLAASATTDTTNAGNIASGTLSNARFSGVALTGNNLSDLANATTARANIGLGALATLGVGAGLSSGGGNLSANVTGVAGRSGAVTLAQADISGLSTTDAPQFAGLQLSTDLFIKRDGANTLALRNGTSAQRGKWFNTYTDASNGEWFDIDWVTNAGTLTLGTSKNGTGSARPLKFIIAGTAVLDIDTSYNLYAYPNAFLGWTARSRMNSLTDGAVAFFNSNSTQMAGLNRKELRATKTANYTVVISENGTIFDNAGATGEVDFTLPASTGNMPGQLFSFTVAAAQTLKIIAAASCKIYYGTTASSTAGNISCNTIGAHVELYAVDQTTWIVKNFTGTWTVS